MMSRFKQANSRTVSGLEVSSVPLHVTYMRLALRFVPSVVFLPVALYLTIGLLGHLTLFFVAIIAGFQLHDRILTSLLNGPVDLIAYKIRRFPIRWVLISPICVTKRQGKLHFRVQSRWRYWTGINAAADWSATEDEQLHVLRSYSYLHFCVNAILTCVIGIGPLAAAIGSGSALAIIVTSPFATVTVSSLLSGFLYARHHIRRYEDPEYARCQVLTDQFYAALETGSRYENVSPEEISALVASATGVHRTAEPFLCAYFWALDRGDWNAADRFLNQAISWVRAEEIDAYVKILHEAAFAAAYRLENPRLARTYLDVTGLPPAEFHTEARIAAAIYLSEGAPHLAMKEAVRGLLHLSPTISLSHAPIDMHFLNDIIKRAKSAAEELEDSHVDPVRFTPRKGGILSGTASGPNAGRLMIVGLPHLGMRPRDLDLEPIQARIDLADGSEREAVGWLRKYWYLLDCGDVTGAETCIDTAVSLCTSIHWAARPLIFQEAAFYAAYFHHNGIRARRYLSWMDWKGASLHTRARVMAAVLNAEGRHDAAFQEAIEGLSAIETTSEPGFAMFDEVFLTQLLKATATHLERPAVWS